MFTCANEKVTFVIKNTYRHCNWSASFEASKYQPSHMSETFHERLGQKPSQQCLQVVFGRFPSILFLFIALNRLQFCTMTSFITPCRGIGILESRVSLWNPELGFENGIQLKEPGIPLKTGYMRRFTTKKKIYRRDAFLVLRD